MSGNRADRWLDDLAQIIEQAAGLIARGRAAFDDDVALRLAMEAIAIRIGEICKRLIAVDPVRFADPQWRLAARTRDLVAHQYDRIDYDLLWRTIESDVPALGELARRARG